jgi:hypothetical protein
VSRLVAARVVIRRDFDAFQGTLTPQEQRKVSIVFEPVLRDGARDYLRIMATLDGGARSAGDHRRGA